MLARVVFDELVVFDHELFESLVVDVVHHEVVDVVHQLSGVETLPVHLGHYLGDRGE